MIADSTASPDERQRILDAAEELFRNEGFQRSSMDDLAKQLGMSKKTIYKHFRSKDELTKEIIQRTMNYLSLHVREILHADRPSVEKLAMLFTFFGSQYSRFSTILKTDLLKFRPELWREVEAFRRYMARTEILPMLHQAKNEGVLRPDVNPNLLFMMVLSSIEGILNPQALAQQPFSVEEAFTGIFKTLFEGAMTPEAITRLNERFQSPYHFDISRVL